MSKTTEIEKKLKKMNKFEIFQICRKMKCPTGTKREMIRYIMLPLKNKNYKMENRCDVCAICLNEVNHGKPEKTTCGHCFHPGCLEKWTEINNTCPMCRRTNPTFPFSGKFNNDTLKGAVKEYLKNEESAIQKYGDISEWDVSNVTDMSRMFDRARSFNGDLSKWDVSNVTNMVGMFYRAYDFDGNISKWNVSNVTNMSFMFNRAFSFNGDISTKEVTLEDGTTYNAWNVSNVTNMEGMFAYATSFNGDLSEWNVSNVIYMNGMFSNANSFNGYLSKWNVNKVKNMSRMFYNANNFIGDLSNWDVSNVENMEDMFEGATKLIKKTYESYKQHSLMETYGT